MIYTITFNPAVDYVIHTDTLCIGDVNRSIGEEIYFGGKGINVSVVLAELGIKSKALGFVGGFTGRAIEDGIKALGIETDFIYLDNGFSRINVKIKSDAETELNGQGPDIPPEKLDALFRKLDKLQNGDTLILAGSIPATLPPDIYEKILDYISHKEIRTVVDAGGELLMRVLKYKPFLIKPNNYELADIFKVELKNTEDIIKYARRLREMGAVNVLVSMAGDGAILIDEHNTLHQCEAFDGKVLNSVGAGDSMVAGFLAGCNADYKFALRLGTAAGSATAFSKGLSKRDDIYELLKQLD